MREIPAETAYLFRHALVREAAYELQPPGERAVLHALALAILEDLWGGAPEIEQPHWLARFRPHPTDAWALELADHAECAAEAFRGEEASALLHRAARYVFRCANLEEQGYRAHGALAQWQRLAAHPGADQYLRAQGHLGAGQSHYRLGNMEEAAQHYDALEPLVAGDPFGQSLLKSCRTVIKSHSDNGPWLADAHQESSRFWAAAGDTRREVASLINFAVWHCEEGDHQVARTSLQRAIEVARGDGNRRAEEAAIGTLALLDLEDGRYDEAEAGLNLALQIAGEMGNTLSEVQWLTGLADLERRRGNHARAEDAFRRAIRHAAEHNHDYKRENAEVQLACLLVRMGRVKEARGLWAASRAAILARGDDYALLNAHKGMQLALKSAGLPPLSEDGRLPS